MSKLIAKIVLAAMVITLLGAKLDFDANSTRSQLETSWLLVDGSGSGSTGTGTCC